MDDFADRVVIKNSGYVHDYLYVTTLDFGTAKLMRANQKIYIYSKRYIQTTFSRESFVNRNERYILHYQSRVNENYFTCVGMILQVNEWLFLDKHCLRWLSCSSLYCLAVCWRGVLCVVIRFGQSSSRSESILLVEKSLIRDQFQKIVPLFQIFSIFH